MMTGIVGILGRIAIGGMMTTVAIQGGGGIVVIINAITITITMTVGVSTGITTIAIGGATANKTKPILALGPGISLGPLRIERPFAVLRLHELVQAALAREDLITGLLRR
jgi:hypothetical protein